MSIEALAGGTRLVLEAPGVAWALLLAPALLWPLLGDERRRWAPAAALRLVAFALVVLAAAGLAIERRVGADRLCAIVAADLSESDAVGATRAADAWIESLAGALGPRDALGALVFGRHANVVSWPASPPAVASVADGRVDGSATRIAAGIEAALPLCPEGSEKKVVLVSDGNETLGDARRAADLARQMGVRVDAVAPVPLESSAIVIEKLVTPPRVRQGSTFPIRIVLRSLGVDPQRVPIEVAVGGETALADLVEVEPGLNVLELPHRIDRRGSVRVAVRVATREGAPADERDATLAVTGPIRALVVGTDPDSSLVRALGRKEIEIERREPSRFPALEELLRFHAVILDDVPRKALASGALGALESYVRRHGGGVVLAGGPRSFGDTGYSRTPLERVLPITFVEQKPRPKERKPMGVYLVVDRSNSMTYSGSKRDVRDGEKMRYAKQAARALISQLDDGDHVGVIAFDSEPYVIGPLRPLGDQRTRIEDRIERLLPGGGTDFKEALEIAGAQLAADELRVRHIILLTDGDSNRGAADHMPLVRTLASLGISVTTLRIGLDDVNLEFLQQISSMTGGRFYHVRRLDELPQLLVRDAKQAEQKGDPASPEEAAPAPPGRVPTLAGASEILRGFSAGDFPPVDDPVRAEPKRGADVPLSLSGEGRAHPVVASWQVGLGRAAVFALDPEAPSGAVWAGWSGYGKLWSQLVRWAIREQSAGEVRTAVRREGERTLLEVETFDDGGDEAIEAEIAADGERSVSLTLMPVAPRLYRAPLPTLPAGRHPITLHRHRGDEVVSHRGELLEIGASLEGSRSAELARRHADRDLLRDVAARTGGTLDPSLDEVLARTERSTRSLDSLRWLLLPLALGCLLGDVALRQRT